MTREDFFRIQAEARATMQALAKIYPGAFTPDGKPIVAEARLLPPLPAPKEPQT